MFNQEKAREIISILLSDGADYAELFVEKNESYNYLNFNNERFTPTKNTQEGTSVRMFYGKEVIFSSFTTIDEDIILKKAKELVSGKKKNDFKFTNVKGGFVENDFENLSIPKIKDKLEKVVNFIKKQEKISIGKTALNTFKNDRFIANSDGDCIKKTSIISQFSFSAIAKNGQDIESVGHSISKQIPISAIVKLFDKTGNKKIVKMSKLAVDLLDAPRMDSGEMPVILPAGFGAVLFHEACGHPLEASFVAKGISKYADKMGQKVASDLVTLIDDGTLSGERGSATYDDEGVKNQRRVLVKKGILKNFLVDRYHANIMNIKYNGAGRRQNFSFNNTARMSNTFIENGTSTVEEIIKNTKYGFYAKRLGGGQVDPFTGQFNFGVTEGYLIKDGAISHLVKNATLIGNGIDAILKVDMIANDFAIDSGTCGAESGLIPVTVGQPTLRVSEMTVGGK